MSCNLDHVLYGKQNSTDKDKKNMMLFSLQESIKMRFRNFLSFISKSDFSVIGNYRESWEYIKQELHSLQRHTNLGLCFTE